MSILSFVVWSHQCIGVVCAVGDFLRFVSSPKFPFYNGVAYVLFNVYIHKMDKISSLIVFYKYELSGDERRLTQQHSGIFAFTHWPSYTEVSDAVQMWLQACKISFTNLRIIEWRNPN